MKNTDKNMDFSAIYAIISEKKGIFHESFLLSAGFGKTSCATGAAAAVDRIQHSGPAGIPGIEAR